MGACCSNKTSQQKNTHSQQQQLISQSQQKYLIPEVQQVEIKGAQELVKPQEVAKQETILLQNKQDDGQKFEEDIFVNDIMKQFDDLNILFNQMSSEFDQISQYLLSMSGNQEQQ